MKIIHTADWHLNDKLGRIDRTSDLQDRVDIVAQLCEEHRADVLLIAGDLFYEKATREEVTQSLVHLRSAFKAFFARGGTILAITGNHDRDHVVELVRAGMGLAAPAAVPIGSSLAPGRMYLFNTAWFGKLRAAGDSFDVQFVMLPYPYPSRYLEEDERKQCKTSEEENRAVQGKLAQWIKNLPGRRETYDVSAQTVLAAHMSVSGADIGRGMYRPTEKEDVLLEGGNLPDWPAYVALGHIHKQQCIRNLSHIRYPGSLDRLDFGERDDERGVVLVDIGPEGRRADPLPLPIEPTPMYDVTIDSDATTEAELRAIYPDAERALARIAVRYRAGTDSRDTIERIIRATFPRFTTIDWQQVGGESVGGKSVSPKADFHDTVRRYLEGQLEKEEAASKQAILELAEQYLLVSRDA